MKPQTLLFPTNDAPVTIKQGIGGDCYLLASLDCILANSEGYKAVKSLFTSTENGVFVKIKRTNLSAFLKTKQLQEKYKYHFDPINNEDVFFLDNKRLKEIDCEHGGVVSNSLAVKILERLSSYYYVSDWDYSQPLASVKAHNISVRHNESSTAFVGKLLGIEAQDSKDINSIIEFKIANPQASVYISIDYGNIDSFGKRHGRHALRIDKIIPNPKSPGGYDFSLANPWNNQEREIYNLDDIRERNYRFCTFNVRPHYYDELVRLPISDSLRETVLKKPQLMNFLLQIKNINNKLTPQVIENCILLCDQMKFLPSLFSLLENEEKIQVVSLISQHNNKASFLNRLKTIPNGKNILFNLLIEEAASEKSKQMNINLEASKKEIDRQLIDFYNSGNETFLTRTADLRFYFIDKILNNSLIEKRFPKLLYKKDEKLLKDKNAKEILCACIQNINATPESFTTCNTEQSIIECQNSLIKHLQELLAGQEVKDAQKLLDLEKVPLIDALDVNEAYNMKIAAIKNAAVNRRYSIASSLLLIRNKIQEITAITVCFDKEEDFEEINKLQDRLESRLNQICDSSLKKALDNLCLKSNPDFNAALLAKGEEISKAATLQREMIASKKSNDFLKELGDLSAGFIQKNTLATAQTYRNELDKKVATFIGGYTGKQIQRVLKESNWEIFISLCLDLTQNVHTARSERIQKIEKILKPINNALNELKSKIDCSTQCISKKGYDEAKILLDTLIKEKDIFSDKLYSTNNQRNDKANSVEFKQACLLKIEKATIALENEVGWMDYLTNLAITLINIPIKIVTLGYWGAFFKPIESHSLEGLENFSNSIQLVDAC